MCTERLICIDFGLTHNYNGFKIYTKMQYKHLSEPWFTLVGLGLKSVEGRLDKGQFATLEPGHAITWYNDSLGHKREFTTVITRITKYNSFKAYLSKESLRKCLPAYGIDTVLQGVKVYREYYSAADERKHGVLAFEMQLTA